MSSAACSSFHPAPVAAISVSLPTVRFSQDRLPELVAALAVTAADIERDLARTTPPGG